MVYLLLANGRNVSLLEADVARLVPMVAEPGPVTGVATNAALDGAVVDLCFTPPILSRSGRRRRRWLNPGSGRRCHQDWGCRFGYRCLLDHDATARTPSVFDRIGLGFLIGLSNGWRRSSTVVLVVLSPTVLLMMISIGAVAAFGMTAAGVFPRIG